jgi:hypothetical protein
VIDDNDSDPHALHLLHPRGPATIRAILSHPDLPPWLGEAIRALYSAGGRTPSAQAVKERLALAAQFANAVNLHMQHHTDAAFRDLYGFSSRKVLRDVDGTDFHFGRGVSNKLMRQVGLTPPSGHEHYARLDATYHIMLKELWSGDLKHTETVEQWLIALGHQATSAVSSVDCASLTLYSTPTPTATYCNILGDGHCWYTCTSRAEGKTSREIQQSIQKIPRQPNGVTVSTRLLGHHHTGGQR